MMTKIDTSSLDNKTLNKIKKYKERLLSMCNGESKSIEIPTSFYLTVVLQNEVMTKSKKISVTPCRIEHPDIHYHKVQKELDKLENKINKEIENIINFSNDVADKLKVNRTKFWNSIMIVN